MKAVVELVSCHLSRRDALAVVSSGRPGKRKPRSRQEDTNTPFALQAVGKKVKGETKRER